MWIRHIPLCHCLSHLKAYFPKLENSFPREDHKPAYVNVSLFLNRTMPCWDFWFQRGIGIGISIVQYQHKSTRYQNLKCAICSALNFSLVYKWSAERDKRNRKCGYLVNVYFLPPPTQWPLWWRHTRVGLKQLYTLRHAICEYSINHEDDRNNLWGCCCTTALVSVRVWER